MDLDRFREEIEEELQSLEKKEKIVQFATICALRALPVLGGSGNFYFWKDQVQTNLFSLFYAIDISCKVLSSHTAASRAYAASLDAVSATRAAADAAAYAASYAASYAARSAYASYAAAAASYAADAAADAASYAADAASYAHNKIDFNSFIKAIKSDLNKIKIGDEIKSDLTIYGSIWPNFLKALRAIDCSYWANLYEDIFENNFQMDPIALERRLNVPKEIRQLGAAEVGKYLENLEQKGATRLNQARIVILGDKGCGKTSLARKLINPAAAMPTAAESTPGVDTLNWKIEGKEPLNVNIWDFAGHVVTHAVHQFFLSERCLYIIVYDGRTDYQNRLLYWLNQMKNYGGASQAIILVNKKDPHPVDIQGNNLKEKYSILEIDEFSIKNDKRKLQAFRKKIAHYIRENPSWKKQDIPIPYYQVKSELEGIFKNESAEERKEHITKEEFEKIALKHGLAEKDISPLLKALHALGISLWYKNIPDVDRLVLNPEWISHGVYKLINWARIKERHSLMLWDLNSVFKDEKNRYHGEETFRFLFKLMMRYELAFLAKNQKDLIIPHLLDKDRPDKLPVFLISESLELRYEASQPLLPNTISRFIVRHHDQIKSKKLVWRYGVVLVDGNGSEALVREDDRVISVSVKGKHKTSFLDSLRATLNDIFGSYRIEKPELQYHIREFGEMPNAQSLPNPIWLSGEQVYGYVKAGELFFDHKSGQSFSLKPASEKYQINAHNVYFGHHVDEKGTLIHAESGGSVLNAEENSQIIYKPKAGTVGFLKNPLVEAFQIRSLIGWWIFAGGISFCASYFDDLEPYTGFIFVLLGSIGTYRSLTKQNKYIRLAKWTLTFGLGAAGLLNVLPNLALKFNGKALNEYGWIEFAGKFSMDEKPIYTITLLILTFGLAAFFAHLSYKKENT